MIRIHTLQHVPFENLAHIESWARQKNHPVSRTLFSSREPLPKMDQFDWLIILGGPMNIYEHQKFPWLEAEKKFIRESISAGKLVLGICLGAQLIADCLGARVSKNTYKEIGWHPIQWLPEIAHSKFFHDLPHPQVPFHWHGDTFEIPPGALPIAKSEACKNQAFEFNRRVAGLQFHLESTPESIEQLVTHCGDELLMGKYVQSAQAIRKGMTHLAETHSTLSIILNRMAECH